MRKLVERRPSTAPIVLLYASRLTIAARRAFYGEMNGHKAKDSPKTELEILRRDFGVCSEPRRMVDLWFKCTAGFCLVSDWNHCQKPQTLIFNRLDYIFALPPYTTGDESTWKYPLPT